MTKKYLFSLLASNKWKELFDGLYTIVSKKRQDLYDDLVEVEGQYNSWKSKDISGVLSNPESILLENIIRSKCSKLINLIFEKKRIGIIKEQFFYLGLAVLFLSGIILSFTRWPYVEFELSIKTKYVLFTLAEDFEMDQYLYLKEFTTYNVKYVELDVDTLIPFEENDKVINDIKFKGGGLRLDEVFGLSEGISTYFLIENGKIFNGTFTNEMTCSFILDSTFVDIPGYLGPKALITKVPIYAELQIGNNPHFSFEELHDSLFRINDLELTELKFDKEKKPGDSKLISEIISGEIKILDSAYVIDENTFLILTKRHNQNFRLKKMCRKGDYFELRVSGLAKNIRIGDDENRMKSMKPSIVEHYSNSKIFNTLWKVIMGTLAFFSTIKALNPQKPS